MWFFVELAGFGAISIKARRSRVVESGRANSDIYAPIAGEIIEINTDLVVDPAKINIDPYDTGWIFKIRVSHPDQVNDLMDAASYSGCDFLNFSATETSQVLSAS